ncbi:RagB/SusD family nutrient uptake outer membrane protein [Odoribacter sp. Z80]|uniref:RagB/SusD family nutrient uptake outer membrane protein n=1 Tax=Odoribacter sp. Z80 TaxID=2304575 RepID=UPI0013796ABE|nr:RagB/SusD family nutrient uptake outer membrane protein [Odoribacter sp. Z80]NCE72706.1 RagB/SusD family nutrient uptake outer membrane protein [Odoribacter sp. Z80]
MKRILYVSLLCLGTLSFSGCNHLLDIKPVNSMIPVSVEDYEAVLVGGYPKTEFFMKTELMTDNVYANLYCTYDAPKNQEPWYVWASTHQLPDEENDAYWGQLYSSVYYANTILDEFEQRVPSESEKELFETVKGEAYALRAYSYFYLVNLYADVYGKDNLDKPGVPMPLTAEDVHKNTHDNVREPIGKVWEQIVKDLNEATKYLAGKTPKSKFRFDNTSLELLKARVYLFMENWDAAIAAASKVIGIKSLFDMNGLQARIDEEGKSRLFGLTYGLLDAGYDKEVLFFTGGIGNGNIFYYSTQVFKPVEELLTLCGQDGRHDYRRYIYESFSDLSTNAGKEAGPTTYHMYGYQGGKFYYIGLKLSEAYLIRAEAYVRRNQGADDLENGLKDLNTLLGKRIADYTDFVVSDFDGATSILNRIWTERRIELAFEGGMRWFDLRRQGKPEISHVYQNGTEYTLKRNDLKYVLQIPESEQKNSPNMPVNPR